MHGRRSIRLPGYDYSLPGAYFVTICTRDGQCILSEMSQGHILLTRIGQLVSRVWGGLPSYISRVHLDEFVVMPNHVHVVLFIGPVGAGLAPPKAAPVQGTGAASRAPTLADVIRVFKSRSTVLANRVDGTAGRRLWQRGFYDHVIRNEDDLNRIREYILHNPLRWSLHSGTALA